jgi:hypothetical protein
MVILFFEFEYSKSFTMNLVSDAKCSIIVFANVCAKQIAHDCETGPDLQPFYNTGRRTEGRAKNIQITFAKKIGRNRLDLTTPFVLSPVRPLYGSV